MQPPPIPPNPGAPPPGAIPPGAAGAALPPGAGGAGPPAAAAGPGAPAPVAFALTPAQATHGLIDYSSRQGERLFNANSAALPGEPYDLDEEGLLLFIERCSKRATSSKWTFTRHLQVGTDTFDIFKEYGVFNIADTQAYAQTYIGDAVRDAQDSMQMALCLDKSLTESALKRVNDKSHQFMVAPDANHPEVQIAEGACMFKTIIDLVQTDTIGTQSQLVDKFNDLPKLMQEANSDITEFHHRVNELQVKMAARKVEQNDINTILQLFKAYAACTDPDFNAFMKREKQEYKNGKPRQGGPLTPQALIAMATNHYQNSLDDGTWNVPSEQENQIRALQAEISTLKKKGGEIQQGKSGGNRGSKGKETANKGKGKRTGWRYERTDESKDEIIHNEKTYNWCPYHEMWTIHHPDDCTLNPGNRNEAKVKNSDKPANLKPNVKALRAKCSSHEHDSDDDDSSVP